MFDKFLNPLTTATSLGVAVRYGTTIVTTVLAILGALNWLDRDQVLALSKQVPELLGALAGAIALALATYATITKSSSDKAAVTAKEIDKEIPADESVTIKTPSGKPDIKVTPSGKVVK